MRALLLGLTMSIAPAAGVSAQNGDQPVMPRADVPYGPGESLEYRVKLGLVTVGDAYLRVVGVEDVRGYETYKLTFGIDASTAFGVLQIHDTFTSYLDTRMIVSRRFHRRINELNYHSQREYEIFPEERRWARTDNDEEGTSPGLLLLDDVSFIHFARGLPLTVGEEYTLNRYFKEEGNPVTIKVLRKQQIEVPAGTFNTVVVQPIINTDGLFSEGGEAELFFTDDEHRHLVYMRSNIPFVGALSLHMTNRDFGTPLPSEGPLPARVRGGTPDGDGGH